MISVTCSCIAFIGVRGPLYILSDKDITVTCRRGCKAFVSGQGPLCIFITLCTCTRCLVLGRVPLWQMIILVLLYSLLYRDGVLTIVSMWEPIWKDIAYKTTYEANHSHTSKHTRNALLTSHLAKTKNHCTRLVSNPTRPAHQRT